MPGREARPLTLMRRVFVPARGGRFGQDNDHAADSRHTSTHGWNLRHDSLPNLRGPLAPSWRVYACGRHRHSDPQALVTSSSSLLRSATRLLSASPAARAASRSARNNPGGCENPMSILRHLGRDHGGVLSELSRADEVTEASLPLGFRGGERLQNLVASEEWGRSPAFARPRHTMLSPPPFAFLKKLVQFGRREKSSDDR